MALGLLTEVTLLAMGWRLLVVKPWLHTPLNVSSMVALTGSSFLFGSPEYKFCTNALRFFSLFFSLSKLTSDRSAEESQLGP